MSQYMTIDSSFIPKSDNQVAPGSHSMLHVVLFWAFLTTMSATVWFAPQVTCKHNVINIGGQQV
jgi:hypothetical protein